MRLTYLLVVLVEPTTLTGVMGLEEPTRRLAHLQYLVECAFLGAGPPEPP